MIISFPIFTQILERLINLTIEQKEMYPSIQAKIWGSIGQVCIHIFTIHIHKSFPNCDGVVSMLILCFVNL